MVGEAKHASLIPLGNRSEEEQNGLCAEAFSWFFFLIMLRRLIRSARVLIKHAMVDDEQDWGLNACQKCRPEGSASFRQLRAGA